MMEIILFERLPYVPWLANTIYLCMGVTILFVSVKFIYEWYKSKNLGGVV